MSLSPEDLKTIMAAMQPAPAAPPAGAITASGIVKYQTIIIFCIMSAVGAGGWLVVNSVNGATKMTNIERDLSELKATRDAITQVKGDQLKTSAEVAELRMTVKSIQTGQEDLAKKMESVSSDVRALGQQMSAISQNLRGRQ
jgi:peptidoglycan hydrolase CwlO-like protein